MNDLTSYRIRTDMIFAVGDVGKISTDSYIQRPDLGKSKTVIGGGGQTPVETGSVMVGDYTYTKPSVNLFHADDPNRGKWIRKYTGDEPLYEFESGPLSGIGAGEVVGTERLDGVETLRLKGVVYSNSFGLDMYAPMEARIWVGVSDGLIRRVTASSADERIGVTMIFSDFDVPVAVEAPKDYITLNTESFDIPHYAPAEITPLDSGWTLAHLRDYGFSVSTPPDWFIHESRAWSRYNPPAPQPEAAPAAYRLSAAILQYVFPGQITAYERDETRVSVFAITIIGTLGDAALSEYVDDRIEHAKALLVIDGAIDRRAETLPAGESERVEFAFRFSEVFNDTIFGMGNDADTDYAQVQYFILAEGDAYILTFATTADRIGTMRPIFDEIARTVRIEGRSP